MSAYFYLDEEYIQQVYSDRITPKLETLGGSNILKSGCLGCVALWGTAFALLMVFALFTLIRSEYNYAVRGVDTPAVVIGCTMKSWGRSGRAPEISYEYSVAGATYTVEHFVARYLTDCDDFPAGTCLTGRYLADNITQSTITDEFANRAWWDVLLMYSAFGCGALFMSAFALMSIHAVYLNLMARIRYPRLLKNGVLLEGEVIKATSSLEGKSKDYHVHIRYQFTTPDGRVLERTQSRARPDLQNRLLPEPGRTVRVFYADDNAVVML